jgi:hypothetical protein
MKPDLTQFRKKVKQSEHGQRNGARISQVMPDPFKPFLRKPDAVRTQARR